MDENKNKFMTQSALARKDQNFKDAQKKHQYNPFKKPANIELAIMHQKCMRISKPSNSPDELCPCCGRPSEEQPLKFCSPVPDFKYMGSGFPLYFYYIRYVLILSTIMFLLVGITLIVNHARGDNCDLESACYDKLYVVTISSGNILNEEKPALYAEIVFFIGGFVIFFAGIFNVIFVSRAELRIDNAVTSPADYTVMYMNIPTKETREEIEDFFKNNSLNGCETKISKVVLCYKIGDYLKNVRGRLKISKEMAILAKSHQKNSPAYKKLQKELEKFEVNMKNFEESAKKGLNSMFVGVALVSYASAKDAQLALENMQISLASKLWNMLPFSWKIGKKYKNTTNILYGERAPEPTDIFWENIGTPKLELFKLRSKSYVVSFVLVVLSFGLIIALQFVQGDVSKTESASNARIVGNYFVSFLVSIIISVINVVNSVILMKLAVYEKHITKSHYNLALTFKLTIASFINTALVIYVSNFILAVRESNHEHSDGTIGNGAYIGSGGLIYDIAYILLFSIFLPPLLNLLDFSYLVRLLKRRSIRKNPNNFFQQEANTWFEGHPISISYRYSNHLKTLLVGSFFCSFLPISFVFVIISVSFQYICDKFLFVTRHSRTYQISSDLAYGVVAANNVIFFVYVLGRVLMEAIFFDAIHVLTKALVIISACLILFPIQRIVFAIFRKITRSKRTVEPDEYERGALSFVTDYDRCNPVYSGDAVENQNVFLLLNKYALNARKSIQTNNNDHLNLLKSVFEINNDKDTVQQSTTENNPFLSVFKDLNIQPNDLFQYFDMKKEFYPMAKNNLNIGNQFANMVGNFGRNINNNGYELTNMTNQMYGANNQNQPHVDINQINPQINVDGNIYPQNNMYYPQNQATYPQNQYTYPQNQVNNPPHQYGYPQNQMNYPQYPNNYPQNPQFENHNFDIHYNENERQFNNNFK